MIFWLAPKKFMTLIPEFMPIFQFLNYLNSHEFENHGHRIKWFAKASSVKNPSGVE